jgi:hypothetical protein
MHPKHSHPSKEIAMTRVEQLMPLTPAWISIKMIYTLLDRNSLQHGLKEAYLHNLQDDL